MKRQQSLLGIVSAMIIIVMGNAPLDAQSDIAGSTTYSVVTLDVTGMT